MKLVEFNSWSEAIDYSNLLPLAPVSHTSGSRGSSTDWAGATWKGAQELMLNGWQDQGEKTIDISQAIFTKLAAQVEVEETIYDVTGENLDVAAFVNGEPEHWMRYEKRLEMGAGRVIKLVINGFFSSGIGSAAINARGAAVTALIQLLEYAGHRVEVVLHVPFEEYSQFRMPVKSADAELNVSRLAFAAGHPAMFRRIAFSMYEQTPEQWKSHYGRPTELRNEYRGEVYIPCMGYGDIQWTKPETAQAWIIENLKKQGVDIR